MYQHVRMRFTIQTITLEITTFFFIDPIFLNLLIAKKYKITSKFGYIISEVNSNYGFIQKMTTFCNDFAIKNLFIKAIDKMNFFLN
ncbi:hypothetical protein HZS_3976 [Henneguya salminicola]|nr:hypothetical protein HZS_3976 [Henneguya salminicola]